MHLAAPRVRLEAVVGGDQDALAVYKVDLSIGVTVAQGHEGAVSLISIVTSMSNQRRARVGVCAVRAQKYFKAV